MSMDAVIRGVGAGTGAEVNTNNQLKVIGGTDAVSAPEQIGGFRNFHEVDAGAYSGSALLTSPEVDVDFRTRVSQDLLLDEEVFNYTTQNTGKHSLTATTMAATWAAGQFTSNSGSITTTTTGLVLATYAFFPNASTTTLSADFELGLSAQPQTNSFVEFGLGIPGGATAAPTDGAFVRVSSAGVSGVASFNGAETEVLFTGLGGTGTWTYTTAKRYQWIVYLTQVNAQFWVNDGTSTYLMAAIQLPIGQSRLCMAAGVQLFLKHRIAGGAAGGVLQANLGAYSVRLGGTNLACNPSEAGNRAWGSYQGLGGGTMGSLASYSNNANPTASVPSNSATLIGGLGGQAWETDTAAVNTDCIICHYQLPAGTVNIQGRRLVLRRVKIDSYIQTGLTGGGYVAQWTLAFGHTAGSLATTDSVNTKAPRRIPLGIQTVASGAVALTVLQTIDIDFGDAPVFVNPSEFVAVVKKKVGTAPTGGVVAHMIGMFYGWE